MKFRVDWVPPTSLGQNAHKHWRSKHPDEQNAHMIGKAASTASPFTADDVPDMPVLIAIIHWDKRSRRKDFDNALGTLKHLVDGICAGLGIDDRRFVTGMTFQKVDPEKRGYTEVLIRPANMEERQLAA